MNQVSSISEHVRAPHGIFETAIDQALGVAQPDQLVY